MSEHWKFCWEKGAFDQDRSLLSNNTIYPNNTAGLVTPDMYNVKVMIDSEAAQNSLVAQKFLREQPSNLCPLSLKVTVINEQINKE